MASTPGAPDGRAGAGPGRNGGCTWTALCLAPVLSAAAALLFERALGLDRLTALSAGVAIGCGMLAFAATTVVSLRVMHGRELLKRSALAAPTPLLSTPVVQGRP